jgi:hypothetical protein
VTGGALTPLFGPTSAMKTFCPPIFMSMRGLPSWVVRMISASNMRSK